MNKQQFAEEAGKVIQRLLAEEKRLRLAYVKSFEHSNYTEAENVRKRTEEARHIIRGAVILRDEIARQMESA